MLAHRPFPNDNCELCDKQSVTICQPPPKAAVRPCNADVTVKKHNYNSCNSSAAAGLQREALQYTYGRRNAAKAALVRLQKCSARAASVPVSTRLAIRGSHSLQGQLHAQSPPKRTFVVWKNRLLMRLGIPMVHSVPSLRHVWACQPTHFTHRDAPWCLVQHPQGVPYRNNNDMPQGQTPASQTFLL